MKIATVLGTRPEIIRLRCVIDVLDEISDHVLIHTGQNFEVQLSKVFFAELGLRDPDHHLGIEATEFTEQVGSMFPRIASLLAAEKPDALLVLGDTNSGLTSVVAKRMGLKVFHMEAGNRCYDDRVPEEINRRVIDHTSSVLMPYTHRSKENLLAEGIERSRTFVIGNPIREVLLRFEDRIEASSILSTLGLDPQGYLLATIHRAENVDDAGRLASIALGLERVSERWDVPLVCSLHPRTADRMRAFGIGSERITFLEPLGLFDFVALERQALCLLTDSGTVQEECCIFGVPAVTVRDVTERPETIECGSNILTGVDPEAMERGVEVALRTRGTWQPPAEYLASDVSEIVGRVILSQS